uniref:Uncharacterized protein MANES_01G231600 n=1 Tax=Rhizophora mucronata TaxID=61149 RepID=A0A2P2LYX7_RHIMU
MSKRRVSLLTVNSFASLSHVCTSIGCTNSIKAPSVVNNFSTAIERSELQYSGGCDIEYSNEHHPTSIGSRRETQNVLDVVQKPNGSYLSSNEGPTVSPESVVRKDQVGQNGTFCGFHGQNYGSWWHSQGGSYQNFNGNNWQRSMNGNQNDPVGRIENFGEYYRHNGKYFQQKESVVPVLNSTSVENNSNGVYGGNRNMQNPYKPYQERLQGVAQNPHGLHLQGNSETPGQSIGYAQNFQKHNGPSDHFIGSVGMYQPGAGQYQQNLNSGQFQQNVNIGQYQPNSSNIQNGVVAHQVLDNAKAQGQSAGSSESSPYKGTLEELDDFCKEQKVKEAIDVLHLLQKQHILVDVPRLLQLMQECGEAKALGEAKVVHDYIARSTPTFDLGTYNKILEMYGKCGAMSYAFDVFYKMKETNSTSWHTMITWLAKNGLGEDAVDLFSQFKQAGMKPDAQMFIGVFSACGVLGDVNEGMLHFDSMKKDYRIVPSMEHYVSVVDMLGSAGYLDEALEFMEKMPMDPSIDVWQTLMDLCRVHGHLELGERCAEVVEQLDPSRLNEQSKAGLIPVKASDLEKEREKRLQSQNILEARSKVHEYRAGDRSHPEHEKIYALLNRLKAQMKEAGYVPETRFVLHDVDQESKEEAILAHSEKLATAYGLLSSPARAPIRILKNLRVCGDCHNALKIISKLVGRELIMRDAKRFHHMKDGVCSCRDYW